MKTRTAIATFALVLAASASHAALAQDNTDNRGHGPHGERMDGGHRGGPPPVAQQAAPGQAYDHRGPRIEARPAAPAAQVPPITHSDRGQLPSPRQFQGRSLGDRWDRTDRGDHRRYDERIAPRPGGDDRWRDGRWDQRGSEHRAWEQRRGGDVRQWERGRYPPIYRSEHRYRVSPYRPPPGYYVRTWAFGDFLPRAWFGPSYFLNDFYDFELPYPPPGYEWVRVGPDALLIDRFTGRIVQVVRDIFW